MNSFAAIRALAEVARRATKRPPVSVNRMRRQNLDEPGIEISEGELSAFRPVEGPEERGPTRPARGVLSALRAQRQKAQHVAPPPARGVGASVVWSCRGEAQKRAAGGAAVHAGYSLVARSAIALHCLERDQREDPVFWLRLPRRLLLQVVVTGGDQHVYPVRRLNRLPAEPGRDGGLQEGRLVVGSGQRPGLRIALRQGHQQVAPDCFAFGSRVPSRPDKRQGTEERQEHMPGGALVRSQSGETADLVPRQGSEEAGESKSVRLGRDQRKVQQIGHSRAFMKSGKLAQGGVIRAPTSWGKCRVDTKKWAIPIYTSGKHLKGLSHYLPWLKFPASGAAPWVHRAARPCLIVCGSPRAEAQPPPARPAASVPASRPAERCA